MKSLDKIGLAIISYNRPEFLLRSIKSLEANDWGGAHEKFIIIDEPYDYLKYQWIYKNTDANIIFKENEGVGPTKNLAFELMLKAGCKNIFTIEDDILLVDNLTCVYYTDYAHSKNVTHLNFALHGELNKDQGKFLNWKRGSGLNETVYVYPHCVGAFSFYTSDVFLTVGFMDENFKNAWEHIEHTWRIALTGTIPPFWYFMDLPKSNLYLKEMHNSIGRSAIRSDPNWETNIENGRSYWLTKHGMFLPDMPNWSLY